MEQELSPTKLQMQKFLEGIPSLPKVKLNVQKLLEPITSAEVKNAIKCLRLGKAPGCDGLTADFYRYFVEDIDDLLVAVFNQILENKSLSSSQKIAIITILFKKGDQHLVNNYRLISLTNCDYKILAYILAIRLEEHLPDLIHPHQTAYMKNHFIRTNVHSVQDVISDNAAVGHGVVLFWIFTKLLIV